MVQKQSGGNAMMYYDMGELTPAGDMMFWKTKSGNLIPWEEHLRRSRGQHLRGLHHTYLPNVMRTVYGVRHLPPAFPMNVPVHQIRMDIQSAYVNAYPTH